MASASLTSDGNGIEAKLAEHDEGREGDGG